VTRPRRTLRTVLRRRQATLPGPVMPPPGDARPAYEIRAEADLLLTYRELILGPEFLGTDLYSQLLLALSEATEQGTGLTQLLFQFGITDVAGLTLLLRAVAMTTTLSTLGWVVDENLPTAFLHQVATYRHPLADPD
jgi:hypothetical protein